MVFTTHKLLNKTVFQLKQFFVYDDNFHPMLRLLVLGSNGKFCCCCPH